ncbi:MAG: hypothetical protein HC794_07615 [Nitrospiraceae bacterium]|nr:hypothetical protein [Nitrospiraceae bacterium]
MQRSIDLSRAGAKEVRVGMSGVREGNTIVVREHATRGNGPLARLIHSAR